MEQYHYIYKITDTVTGQYYIGMRSCNVEPELDDYMGSGLWICEKAAFFSGKKNVRRAKKTHFKSVTNRFLKEVIEYCGCRGEVANREEYHVKNLWRDDNLCMNKVVGGLGGFGFGEAHPKYDSTKYHMWNHNTKEEFYATTSELANVGVDISILKNGKINHQKGICLYENKNNSFKDTFTIYHMWNHNTQKEFYATSNELKEKYGIGGNTSSLVNNIRRCVKGIVLFENRHKPYGKDLIRGNSNKRYDSTLYHFWNHNNQEEFWETKNNMRHNYGLGSNICGLISGKFVSVKGICLFVNKNKPYGYKLRSEKNAR